MLSRLSVVLACAVLLAGCGGDPVAEEDKILIPSTSSPLGPSDSKDDASAQAKPKKEKKPTTVVRAAGAGVRFRLPAGWTVLSDSDVDYATSGAMDDIVEQSGFPVAQVEAMIAQVDAFVVGFSAVLTVAPATTSGLPSEDQYRAMLGDAAAGYEAMESVRTPLGEGRVFRSTLTTSGVTMHSLALYVHSDNGVAEIVVGSPDAGQARQALDVLVPTLGRA